MLQSLCGALEHKSPIVDFLLHPCFVQAAAAAAEQAHAATVKQLEGALAEAKQATAAAATDHTAALAALQVCDGCLQPQR